MPAIGPEVVAVFGTETSMFLAVQLAAVLERLLEAGIEVEQETPPSDRDALHEALERGAKPIIKGIIGRFRPGVIANVQGMDEGSIWKLFWNVRKERLEPKPSIFGLIVELNRDPPFATAFA